MPTPVLKYHVADPEGCPQEFHRQKPPALDRDAFLDPARALSDKVRHVDIVAQDNRLSIAFLSRQRTDVTAGVWIAGRFQYDFQPTADLVRTLAVLKMCGVRATSSTATEILRFDSQV